MAKRLEIIKRYEKIIEKWNDDETLIKMFPEKYREICLKLEALKAGIPYTITDVTKESIQDMGAKICGVQQTYDKRNRLVRDFRNCNYEYKTDIPKFVDRITRQTLQGG